MKASSTPSISIKPSISYFGQASCTSIEAFSSNEFRLTSSRENWACGVSGTTPITGFEFTVPDHITLFEIGLYQATKAFSLDHRQWDYKMQPYGRYYTTPILWTTGGGKHQVPYSSTDDVFGMALHNSKAHYLINGIVISESPNVPAVDYLFGFTMSWLPADNNNAGINVTFVDPLSHWGTLN
jgi:hypothetical protein